MVFKTGCNGDEKVSFRLTIVVSMVLKYRVVAQNMLRTYEVKEVFSEKNTRFDDSFLISKCHQQIEIPDLLHMCTPCSELPSNIICTMVVSFLGIVGKRRSVFHDYGGVYRIQRSAGGLPVGYPSPRSKIIF